MNAFEDIKNNAPTAPESINIRLLGFGDEEYAKELGNTVANAVRALSRFIDSEILDGITIAHDYNQALAELDRGVDGLKPLTGTQDDNAVGVAMCQAVLRDSNVKAHLVLNALVANQIMSSDKEEVKSVLCIIAHELGHAQDIKLREIAFPGTYLRETIKYSLQGILHHMSEVCWSEYIATRVSACFHPEQIKDHEDVFVSKFLSSPTQVNDAIRAYRTNGDIDKLLYVAVKEYGTVLKYASYVIGHLHGTGLNLIDNAQNFYATICSTEFEPICQKLDQALGDMHTTYGSWNSKEVWDKVGDVAWEYLDKRGLTLRAEGEKLHIDVPFRRETMPR